MNWLVNMSLPGVPVVAVLPVAVIAGVVALCPGVLAVFSGGFLFS